MNVLRCRFAEKLMVWAFRVAPKHSAHGELIRLASARFQRDHFWLLREHGIAESAEDERFMASIEIDLHHEICRTEESLSSLFEGGGAYPYGSAKSKET